MLPRLRVWPLLARQRDDLHGHSTYCHSDSGSLALWQPVNLKHKQIESLEGTVISDDEQTEMNMDDSHVSTLCSETTRMHNHWNTLNNVNFTMILSPLEQASRAIRSILSLGSEAWVQSLICRMLTLAFVRRMIAALTDKFNIGKQVCKALQPTLCQQYKRLRQIQRLSIS